MSKLKVLIGGGGIGGLAVGLALLKQGVDVEIYEQAVELREVGAGIQISPNGNRALNCLGVFEQLKQLSTEAESKEIRLWNTGKTWKLFDLGKEAIKRYGFPYMTVYRPNLLQVLANAVRQIKPDAIRLGARCMGVGQNESQVTLELDGEETVVGDALIGADGVHSRIRGALFGADKLNFSGMVAWRTLIPMNLLPAHMARKVATNWIGPGGHVVHYPLNGGTVMNFVGTLEGNSWASPPWNAPATVEACTEAFQGWHADVLAMISKAPSILKWALCGRDFLNHWTRGRATLMGDACHPTLPFLAQGAVFTIEDAVVLGRCFEKYRDDIPVALARYETARLERAYRMVRGAADNTSRFHHTALANPQNADQFVADEWQQTAISERYDWLFNYDAMSAEV